MKFKRGLMSTDKHALIKKKKKPLKTYNPNSKISLWSGNTESPIMKKFRVQQSAKRVILTDFWHMKGPITIDYIDKV